MLDASVSTTPVGQFRPLAAGARRSAPRLWISICAVSAVSGLAGLGIEGRSLSSPAIVGALPMLASSWDPPPANTTAQRVAKAPIMGDEGFWLSSLGDGTRSPATRFVVGDHLSLSGKNGVVRTFEVVELKPFDVPMLSPAAVGSPARPHLTLVTAREQGIGHDGPSSTIKFLIEAATVEAEATPLSPAKVQPSAL